jgi:hypothetical protein
MHEFFSSFLNACTTWRASSSCNDQEKSASYICAVTPKGLVNLELPYNSI